MQTEEPGQESGVRLSRVGAVGPFPTQRPMVSVSPAE